MELHLSQDPQADALLSTDPLALLIGMVLDQQVPLEWAFAGPAELQRRLGGRLDARFIAQMDPEDLANAFAAKPALHRYPGSMAARVQALCRLIVETYDGDASAIWSGVSSGAELLTRVKQLPGFGDHKARIFVALLGKQLGVRPTGWEKASAPFGEPGSFRSVADITDAATLAKVRTYKQQMKATATTTPRRAKKSATTSTRASRTGAPGGRPSSR